MDDNTTEATDEETEQPPRPSNANPADVDFFSRAFAAGTTDGHTDKEPATPHGIAEFEVPYELCGKHLKSMGQDFMLQLKTLSPKQEARISKTVESGAELSMAFARESVVAMNGAPLKSHEKEWLWGHLGPSGRQLVIGMYAEAFMADPKALTKAKESRGK